VQEEVARKAKIASYMTMLRTTGWPAGVRHRPSEFATIPFLPLFRSFQKLY
jgi:hypothetical protein